MRIVELHDFYPYGPAANDLQGEANNVVLV
jgi:hypothetical protein